MTNDPDAIMRHHALVKAAMRGKDDDLQKTATRNELNVARRVAGELLSESQISDAEHRLWLQTAEKLRDAIGDLRKQVADLGVYDRNKSMPPSFRINLDEEAAFAERAHRDNH